ncbi:MAG: hypothetical protein V1724_04685 [Chloroflexota bacterium]
MILFRLPVRNVPASWGVHLAFVFLLTLLVYRNLLGARNAGLYLGSLLGLMAGWETWEWMYKPLIEGSLLLTGVDTFMDTGAGLMGAMIAMKLWRKR